MEILKKVYYHQLEKVKDILKVKEIYCIPVFREWFSEKEIKEIKMNNFLTVWKQNFDWFFSENNWYKIIEKIENVYFSKKNLENKNYLDYLEELKLYMFTD